MQIKSLVIEGFGRYVKKQTLDFERELKGRNIFVVTGKTGAGKTTIFDAINFALYGDASGSSRDGKSLRSDHADINTPTEVELVFSIRDKTYKVVRSPQYLKAKSRGEGTTVSTAAATLTLPEGRLVTGYQSVTDEIEKILGITPAQFKQLVMIPQGEFKKLLEAPSSQKETIFRKIFGTQTFSLIQNKISEEANKLKQDIKEIQVIRDKRIRSFDCNKDEELIDLIQSKDINIKETTNKFRNSIELDSSYYQELDKQIEVSNKEVEELNKELIISRENNKKFDTLEDVKKQIEELRTKEAYITNQKNKVVKAQKALLAVGLEEQYIANNRTYLRLNKDIEKLSADIKDKEVIYAKAEAEYELEQSKDETRNKYTLELGNIDVLIDKVSEYERVSKILIELQGKKVLLSQEALIEEEKLEDITIKESNLEKELEEIRKEKEIRADITIELKDIEKLAEDITVLDKGITERQDYEDKHNKNIQAYERINREYISAKNEYENKEELLKRNKAGILAKDLVSGIACPVCGSKDHPCIASIEEANISDQIVEEFKQVYYQKQQENEAALSNVKKYYELIQHIEQNTIYPMANRLFDLGNNIKIDSIKEYILNKNKTVTEKISNLKNKLDTLERKIALEINKIEEKEQIKKDKENIGKIKELKYKQLQDLEIQIKGNDSEKAVLSKDFEGNQKTLEELKSHKIYITQTLDKLKKALNNSKEVYDKTKEDLSSYKIAISTKSEEVAIVEKERERNLEDFKNKVFELGFKNGQEYKESKMLEEDIVIASEDIKMYDNAVLTLTQNRERLENEVETLFKVDLLELTEKINVVRDNKKLKEEESKVVYSKLEANKSILVDVLKYTEKIASQEEKYGVLGILSTQINGDNPRKMSLERYVLAAYFEDIIAAANLRLIEMTSNQYELFRKEEVGDARKQQGLELEVLDNYTGKRRDVTTLSGGEGFKASLALALGLADVVQGYAGGIQLDTMFIDEGFGTLDPESLEAAIECLVDLKNDGRVVGIISHVEELKERIPTHLHVISTSEGSQVKFEH